MASRRFIDRLFWKCRELNQAPARTRLLFIYLFGEEADDFGRAKDDPYLMKRGCFSDDDVAEADVAAMLDELVKVGLVSRYLARDESPLLWLPTFHDYQPMGYWLKSRLDRHPDDDFEAFDWIGARNKRVKTARPLCPVGHVYANCHNPTESDTIQQNLAKVDTPIPIPIPIPTPVPAGAPKGQRAEPDTATDLEAFAAEPLPGNAEAALPFGGGTDAPTTDSKRDNDHGAFDEADDPAEASRIWGIVETQLHTWNGHDPGEQRKARAKARGMMRSHEGQVDVLSAMYDSIYATKTKVDERWYTFGQLLKNRRSGSPEARKWAKGITG